MSSLKFACAALASVIWLSSSTQGQAQAPEKKAADLLLSGMKPAFQLNRKEPNLLNNGDFERGLEGWNFAVWRDRTSKAAKDSDAAPFGYASIRITQPNATDSSLSQTVTLKEGRRYRLSGWIKTENVVKPPSAKQRPGEEGASLTILGGYQKTPSVTGTQDWTRVSMEFTPKPGELTVKLGPRLGHYGKLVTGTAWFADVALIELK